MLWNVCTLCCFSSAKITHPTCAGSPEVPTRSSSRCALCQVPRDEAGACTWWAGVGESVHSCMLRNMLPFPCLEHDGPRLPDRDSQAGCRGAGRHNAQQEPRLISLATLPPHPGAFGEASHKTLINGRPFKLRWISDPANSSPAEKGSDSQ